MREFAYCRPNATGRVKPPAWWIADSLDLHNHVPAGNVMLEIFAGKAT